MKDLLGERVEDKGQFWLGANGVEYIAWEGSFQIFIYPTWEWPAPPSGFIQAESRIWSLEDFDETLRSGVAKEILYTGNNYHPDYSKM